MRSDCVPARSGVSAYSGPCSSRRLARLSSCWPCCSAAAGCGLFGDRGPDAAVEAFLAAWSAGDDRAAAALTDDPPAAAELLVATRECARRGRG